MTTPSEAKPSVQGLADWLRREAARHDDSPARLDPFLPRHIRDLRAWASAVEFLEAPEGQAAQQTQPPKEQRLYRTDAEAADELLELLLPGLQANDLRTDGGNINMPKVRALLGARSGNPPGTTGIMDVMRDVWALRDYLAMQVTHYKEPEINAGRERELRRLEGEIRRTVEQYGKVCAWLTNVEQAVPAQAEMTDAEILEICKQADLAEPNAKKRFHYLLADGVLIGNFQAAMVRNVRAILSARKERGDALLRRAVRALAPYSTDPAKATAAAIREYLEGK